MYIANGDRGRDGDGRKTRGKGASFFQPSFFVAVPSFPYFLKGSVIVHACPRAYVPGNMNTLGGRDLLFLFFLHRSLGEGKDRRRKLGGRHSYCTVKMRTYVLYA